MPAIQARYAALRGQSDDEVILAELCLIAALTGLQAFAELQAAFDALLRRQPETPALLSLRQRFGPVLEAAEKAVQRPT